MKAGTVVMCPDCKAPQIKSTIDLKPGDKMGDAGWISMGWDMEGMRMGCYACGSLWSRKHPLTKQTQLYIDGEWVPLDKDFKKIRKPLIIA